MSIVDVGSAAQLSLALSTAGAGDVIRLAAGNYGDVAISGMNFASDLTIISADAGHPAVFNSLTVAQSSGVEFIGITVDLNSTEATTTGSSVVMIDHSSNITLHGGVVKAEMAISGVSATATALDSTGNVVGLPTARGFTVQYSSHVNIEQTEISQVFRGLHMAYSDNVSIGGNFIHDVRTSSISGGAVSHVTIDNNTLTSSRPWALGPGDHDDFIHLWTQPGAAVSTDIKITNNTLEQGDGSPIIGIYLDDNTNKVGFTKVTISNNMILDGQNQGIRLENVSESAVTGNTLLDTIGSSRHAPGILIDGSHDLDVSGNITAFGTNHPNSTANIHDNFIVQDTNPKGAGYYTPDLVNWAAPADPATVRDFVAHNYANLVNPLFPTIVPSHPVEAAVGDIVQPYQSLLGTTPVATAPVPVPTAPGPIIVINLPDFFDVGHSFMGGSVFL